MLFQSTDQILLFNTLYSACMVYVWCMCGACMVHVWCLYGAFLGFCMVQNVCSVYQLDNGSNSTIRLTHISTNNIKIGVAVLLFRLLDIF